MLPQKKVCATKSSAKLPHDFRRLPQGFRMLPQGFRMLPQASASFRMRNFPQGFRRLPHASAVFANFVRKVAEASARFGLVSPLLIDPMIEQKNAGWSLFFTWITENFHEFRVLF